MKKGEDHRIGDRLGFYGADGVYRTYREIHAKPRVPVSTRIGHAWRTLNKPRTLISGADISKRKAFAVLLVGFALFLLIGNMAYRPTVEAAFTDYHQVGHTVTPLWLYNTHDSTRWNYNSTCINFDNSAVPNKAIEFQYTLGDAINTDITLDSYAFGNRDSLASIGAVHPSASTTSSQAQSFQFTSGGPKQIFSAKVSLSKTGSPVGNLAVQLYLGDAAVGSAKPTGSALAESGYVTMESLTGTPTTTTFSFNATNRYTLAPSTAYVIAVIAKSATTLGGGDLVNVGYDGSASSHQGIISYYNNGWNAQPAAFGDLVFEVVGQATGLGANCASASTIISKASINLQSVAGRQLVGVMQWNLTNSLNRGTHWQMFLRTNGTLPAFNEGWVASADERVRLLWRSTAGDTSGTQYNYVNRGTDKSIDDEGVDTIVQQQAWTAAAAATGIEFDMALNFTGPMNVLYRFTGRTDGTNNYYFTETLFQSQLQLSQDYFVGFNVIWDTTIAPAGTSEARLLMGTDEFQSGNFDQPLELASVPAMCNDQKNLKTTNCAFTSGDSRTFDIKINPLDPSSWANAIVKGLLWVFTVILGFLGLILQAVVVVFRGALDTAGLFLGVGLIGTAITSALSGFGTWVASIFTTIFAQSVNLATFVIRGLSFLTVGFTNVWNGTFAWLTELGNIVGFVFDVITDIMRWSFLGVKWLGTLFLVGAIYTALQPSLREHLAYFRFVLSITLDFFKTVFWIGEKAFDIILKFKQLLTGWL